MTRALLMLAITALVAAPAMADLVGSTPRTAIVPDELTTFQMAQSAPAPRTGPIVYQNADPNGYYRAYNNGRYWDGELCITTAVAPSWVMDSFGVGWYAPLGAPQTTMYVDFFANDGYYPWSGSWVGGYSIPVTADGYAHTAMFDVSASPLTFTTQAVWFVYSFDVHGTTNMGPLHVYDPAEIGTDYNGVGWYEYNNISPYYHNYWYGLTGPSGALYAVIPEPATLALLALGGLVLIRRR